MKKVLILFVLQITVLMAYTIKEGVLIPQTTEESFVDDPFAEEPMENTNLQNGQNGVSTAEWTSKPLPEKKFNVLNYGLRGDGRTDDTAALKRLAQNRSVTNWYFPKGYTFRLYEINIPNHVTAIFGGATIKRVVRDVRYPAGPFFQSSNHNDLLIDGLHFVNDNTIYKQNEGNYGFITIAPWCSVRNWEIRNCIFDGTNGLNANGITVYGAHEAGGAKHINIHDNKFFNTRRAGIEILMRSKDKLDDDDGIEDINIYNNVFDFSKAKGGWLCGISFSGPRKPCSAVNNRFIKNSWDIELNGVKNITVKGNISVGCRKYFISDDAGWAGTGNKGAPKIRPGVNWIYQNHFSSEKASIHIINHTINEIYDNYINGQIWYQKNGAAHVYNNIIVKNLDIKVTTSNSSAIRTSDKIDALIIENNKIYCVGSSTSTPAIDIGSGSSNRNIIKNNKIYMKNRNECIKNSGRALLENNQCVKNYSAMIPSSFSK